MTEGKRSSGVAGIEATREGSRCLLLSVRFVPFAAITVFVLPFASLHEYEARALKARKIGT
jgi:hypothetical protein